MKDIYNQKFIEELFNKMSGSYERVNYITSFGFSERWRRQCVKSIEIKKNDTVLDLMTGMGECWKPILNTIGVNGKLIGLDFSEGMLNMAHKRRSKYPNYQIKLLKENVFKNTIQNNSIDSVISGFGLKTFSDKQLHDFSDEVNRVLKTNGSFSFIEVSVPKNKLLKFFYLNYVRFFIPILGFLFLGNPETYKMLGVYTSKFNNAERVKEIFEKKGFNVEYINYFYGCATGIKGQKN
ncbi:class I SAM-dependent methyltransferase [Olleya sp. YS]|uniref:class I SAM-dependent methyltransferase n=1 Tax=Olleya sp. YS TaxID=3028318 RepID=UPI0024342F2F|nr:class I SAM-dependent methyltransferase [Olleya sp. YS]WGD35697.1 class I SAM-dependent methyltransferase [Olleya sp. YS]